MDRRAFLSTLAGAWGLATAGCVAAPTRQPTPAEAPRSPAPRLGDVELPVPESQLLRAGFSVIPTIDDPAFGPDWAGLEIETGNGTYEPRLRPEEPVIGVERAGTARAYPLGILERHEVVNDTIPEPDGTTPLLVTYCPSCGSSMTARRAVGGEPTEFEVSHFLWRSNLVLRDTATGSLWSQLLATAIRGPATGERLQLVPSTLEPWGAWRDAHPATEVLLPPPLSGTRYDLHQSDYEYNRFTDSVSIIGEDADGVSRGRTLVIGVTAGGAAKAYPFDAVVEAGVVNDTVGGTPVVVTVGPGGSLAAYIRRVDGTTLRFQPAPDGLLEAGGSRWLPGRGVAIDGPFEGVQLRRANDVPPLFRFAWVDFHPDTAVFGEDA